MKTQCPICFVKYRRETICSFCAPGQRMGKLIEWQLNQIDNIPSEDLKHVVRNIYSFVIVQVHAFEKEVKNLSKQIEHNARKEDEREKRRLEEREKDRERWL